MQAIFRLFFRHVFAKFRYIPMSDTLSFWRQRVHKYLAATSLAVAISAAAATASTLPSMAVFDNEADFNNWLSSNLYVTFGTESFEGAAPLSYSPISVGALGTLDAPDAPPQLQVRGNPGLDGRFATDGTQYVDSRDSTNIEFSLGAGLASALGLSFTLTDVDDAGGDTKIQFFNGGTAVGGMLDVIAGGFDAGSNANVRYIGLLFGTEAVDSFGIFVNNGSDGVGIDEVSGLAPVPLPAAAWMLLAGLGALVVMKRRTQV